MCVQEEFGLGNAAGACTAAWEGVPATASRTDGHPASAKYLLGDGAGPGRGKGCECWSWSPDSASPRLGDLGQGA